MRMRIKWVIYWSIFLGVGMSLVGLGISKMKYGKAPANDVAFSALLILFGATIISRLAHVILANELRKSVERRGEKFERARYTILFNLVTLIIYLFALASIFYLIPELRSVSVSLLAGVGVAAIVIGLAAQEVLSNIIAGIFIAIFQPFKVGDYIKFSGEVGKVEDITMRHTVITTLDNRRLVVPNAVIGKEVITNYSMLDEKVLEYVEMTISYDSDIDKAKRIMMEEIMKHPQFFDPHEDPFGMLEGSPVVVRVVGLTDFAVKLRAYFWAKNAIAARKMKYDLTEKIKKRLDAEGIEIPFPYRTIVYKKDLEEKKGK
jgi:small-conductance mechanosensitive channel